MSIDLSLTGKLFREVVELRRAKREAQYTLGLTNRESEVLRLIASGARNKEIADQLFLTVNTVKFHIENIYEKLDVQTRTQAVRAARERGLLNV